MAGESGGECERVCENESNREKDRKREVGGDFSNCIIFQL